MRPLSTLSTICATAVVAAALPAPAHALFVNGGFETGDFAGWTLEYGYFPGGTLDNVLWGVQPHAKWEVIGPGALQPGQQLVVDPYSGNLMARINDVGGGNHATRLSQTDTVTVQDVSSGLVLAVQWGAMLVDPKHAPGQQPIFGIKIRRNGTEIASFSADATAASTPGSGWIVAGFDQNGEHLWYAAGTFELAMSNFLVGDSVTIEVAVADCALGGHGAFAFLDGIGTAFDCGSTCDPALDLNDDGSVGAADLGLLLAAWGTCPSSPVCPDGCGVLPAGLIAWWRAEGNLFDSVGANDGQLAGAAAFESGLGGGQAFSFDGSGAPVLVPHADAIDATMCESLTVVAWVWRDSDFTIQFQHVLGKRDGCVDSPPNSWQIPIDSNWLPAEEWRMLALVIDRQAGELRYWHNLGYLVTPLPASVSNTVPFTIGTSGTCQSFAGRIDEVQVYDRALSAQELESHYLAVASGMCLCPPPLCTGDLDQDGDVDAADLGILLAGWCN